MTLPTLQEAKGTLLAIHRTNSEAVEVPLLVRFQNEDQALWIIGTRHTRDSDDRQIAAIEAIANLWLKETGGGAICLEGRLPHVENTVTLAEAVTAFGEGAVLSVFGQRSKIAVVSIEPAFADVTSWALEIMPDSRAFASWAVLNMLSGLTRSDGSLKETAVSLLATALPKIGAQYGIIGDASDIYANVAAHITGENIIPLPPTLDALMSTKLNYENLTKAQKAGDGPYVTNHAAVAMNLARDYGLLCNTLKTTESAKSVIVWTGLNHLLSQMPELEAVGFKKNSPA